MPRGLKHNRKQSLQIKHTSTALEIRYRCCPIILHLTSEIIPVKLRDALQVCALNGYGCVDTEYAWYQQLQQQHVSPYTSLLMASGADHIDDGNKTLSVYPATPADYCPSCIALYAAEADAAAVSEAATSG